MSTADNKRLIRRLYDEGFNRQDAARAARFYAEDAMNHMRTVGRAGMQRVFEGLFSIFPDFRYEILNETAEADRVVCKVMLNATHLGRATKPEVFNGMFRGVEPTGRRVEVLQYHDFLIRGTEIAAHAAVRDDLGMVMQLGLVQRPG